MKPRKLRRPLAAALLAASFLLPVIGNTGAARADDSDLKNDARLEQYGKAAALDVGTAPYYMLVGGLAILGLSVMFKNAKRSHLD